MHKQYLHFLAHFVVIFTLFNGSMNVLNYFSLPNIERNLATLCPKGESECYVALSKCLPFLESTIYDLQQIPGMQEKLSYSLLENRNLVLKSSKTGYKKLTEIKGIGEKRGQAYYQYLCPF